MTVVKIDVVSLGMAAARMLIQQLRAGEQSPEHLLLPVSIIERGSTKMREKIKRVFLLKNVTSYN